MTIRPERRHRRSIRLRGYDYTRSGAYFITICSRERASLFADFDDGMPRLTPVGEVVSRCWEAIPDHFPGVGLDACVIMPNHLHGIVVIESSGESVGTACRAPTGPGGVAGTDPTANSRLERYGTPVAGSIPTVVRSFKAAVTKAINDDPGRGTACRAFLTDRLGPLPPGRIPSLWQRGYHEHVIRNERALDRLRAYIASNPARWAEDSLHPEHPASPAANQSGMRS